MSNSFYPPPRGPLPPRQAECLAFIDAELAKGCRFPTFQQIAKHMGWENEHSAYDCLMRLAWRGRVKRSLDGVWSRIPA